MNASFPYVNVTRYLSGAGLAALVYDHILTLPSEISLIWPAPSSCAKYIFLFNRYLVPGALLAIAWEMNHFGGPPLTDEVGTLIDSQRPDIDECKDMLSSVAMLSIVSLGMANILVLLRVAILWDQSRGITWLLIFGFVVSFGTASSMMVASLVELADTAVFSPLFSMCILLKTTPKLIVVWGAPMVFEIIVLVATLLNALSVPRQANMPLRNALHRDGIAFFMALSLLRAINLSLAATRRPELAMLTVFFVWSMTTLILNRSLLRLQHAEYLQLVLNGMIEKGLPRNRRSSQHTSGFAMNDYSSTGGHWMNSKFYADNDDMQPYRLKQIDNVLWISSDSHSSGHFYG